MRSLTRWSRKTRRAGWRRVVETAPSGGQSLGEAVRAATLCLKDAGIDTARLDARVLLCHVTGLAPETLIARPEQLLAVDALARFEEAIARRASREPVAYITGTKEFWSLEFAVSPATLIPRPDSETLVAAALRHIADDQLVFPRVLDLGTGTGCLLLSVLHECPGATGVGIDIEPWAAAVAQGNAERLGLGARAAFCVGDWVAPFRGRFDVVLANPPYVREADRATLPPDIVDHEPARALFAGDDGEAAYAAIAASLPGILRPKGRAFVELGRGQATRVAAIFAIQGLKEQARHQDIAGVERCAEFALVNQDS